MYGFLTDLSKIARNLSTKNGNAQHSHNKMNVNILNKYNTIR